MRRLLIIALCLLPLNVWGATKIGQMDFEQNLTDPYGKLSTEDPGGATYVESGRTGYSGRFSHNSSDAGGDGDDDDFQVYWSLPASGEYYVKAYIKYETAYDGFGSGCSGTQNVKWYWVNPTGPHWELIWQYANGFAFSPSGGATWSDGTMGTKYAPWGAERNVWHKVEMYVKQSTGASHTNLDGHMWLKIDDVEKYNESGLNTGGIPVGRFPATKASCQCDAGEGWWQLDDYEVWDGIPDAEEEPPSTPTIRAGGIRNGGIR